MNAIEIERKYLIRMPDVQRISAMDGCVRWEIVQTYLQDGPNGETRRVRRIFTEGREQLFFTEKLRLSQLSSIEREREIDRGEYEALLAQADPESRSVEKLRLRVPYEGQLLEIDIYSFWNDRATLEIEMQSEDQALQLPDWIEIIRDVSGDFSYKNRMLAKRVPMESIG